MFGSPWPYLTLIVVLVMWTTWRVWSELGRQDLAEPLLPPLPKGRIDLAGGRVFLAAAVEARLHREEAIGELHLLLALASVADPAVHLVWKSVALDGEDIRWRVKEGLVLGEARSDSRQLLVSHGTNGAIRCALAEGTKLGHHTIGPIHLLLGLLREGGAGAEALAGLGVTLERARAVARQV